MIAALRFSLAILVCLLALPALAAFTDNGDGTVTDSETGLMWDKCSWGQSNTADCSGGGASSHDWTAALGVAITANSASHRGYSDWRLPNRTELESLVMIDTSYPAIDTTAFPNTPSNWFWTSTTFAPNPAGAWVVDFYDGGTYATDKADSYYVRLVRSGQSFGSFDSLAVTADTTPDAFSFTDQPGVARSSIVQSNTITVSGINSAASIAVSGGEYRLNGGAWTSAAGTVSSGATVQVRHTASASYATKTDTTLTVGGVSDTFSSTTLADPGATSGGATLSGLSVVCPASLTAGETATLACVATATYSNGTSKTVTPTWQATGPGLSIDAAGFVSALAGSSAMESGVQATYSENGYSQYALATIQINAATSTGYLLPDFTYAVSASDPLKVDFTAAGCASSQCETYGYEYLWYFDDETAGTAGKTLSRTFAAAGEHRATLCVLVYQGSSYLTSGCASRSFTLTAGTGSTGTQDGTYTDAKTGLSWMRCSMGQTWSGTTCEGTATGYTYDQAKAVTHSFAGHADWRLPTPGEMLGIVDYSVSYAAGQTGATIDGTLFPNLPHPGRMYWVKTPETLGVRSFGVDFYAGELTEVNPDTQGKLRLVRGRSIDATATTPSGDFADNGDGTLTHQTTGLTWMRCSMGQTWSGSTCTGSASTYAYEQAAGLTASFAGRTDWRTPSIAELVSIMEYGAWPAINASLFPATPQSQYWSATPYASSRWTTYAWAGKFTDGSISGFTSRGSSLPVRMVSTSKSSTAGSTATASSTVSARANASGGNASLSLTVDLSIDAAVVGQSGSVYLAALLNGQWFLHNGAGWVAWSGGTLPAYFTGTLPASLNLPVVTNTDVRGLMGVQVYVGYGRDADEMLAANRVLAVHTVR